MEPERLEAVQAVVDRLTSYQESATDRTVEQELRSALADTDVDLDDEQVARLTSAIEGVEEGDGGVDVAEVLG